MAIRKFYRGERRNGGAIVSVVDGKISARPLDPRLDLANHSPTGLEWGYHGSGPAQLALAILADYLCDDRQAIMLYQDFKRCAIATIVGDKWVLTGEQIAAHLIEILGGPNEAA